MPKQKTIADQLKAAIRDSGLTRYRIAKDAGIKQAIIDRFVSGKRSMTMDTAAKICEALNLELKPKS